MSYCTKISTASFTIQNKCRVTHHSCFQSEPISPNQLQAMSLVIFIAYMLQETI